MDIAQRLSAIQQEIQTAETEKLQQEQMLGLIWAACYRSRDRRKSNATDKGPHSRSGRKEEGAARRRASTHCAGWHPRSPGRLEA